VIRHAVRERAFAKVNLVLHVGPPGADGLHPICSLFASLDLADDVLVSEGSQGGDAVLCAGVEGPNLAERALTVLREALPGRLPALEVRIEKRIPVAAGLGGGSADAAAVLRAANELAGFRLRPERLRALAASIGSDVPSQVEPGHALVTGLGEEVEPLSLPGMALVLVPGPEGLRTAEVYAELDRLDGHRRSLDPGRLRRLATGPLEELAPAVENDLEPAALSLCPAIEPSLTALRGAGALAVTVAGSGPTAFGVFGAAEEAERAAAEIPGAFVTLVRGAP
jgi:4-diphosphocytidyl-2-C-methyl-D-erythritol kinase